MKIEHKVEGFLQRVFFKRLKKKICTGDAEFIFKWFIF